MFWFKSNGGVGMMGIGMFPISGLNAGEYMAILNIDLFERHIQVEFGLTYFTFIYFIGQRS